MHRCHISLSHKQTKYRQPRQERAPSKLTLQLIPIADQAPTMPTNSYHNYMINMNISTQYQDQSPTISSKKLKELPHTSGVQNPVEFSVAPKRKRDVSVGAIFASRQHDNDDDEFVYPLLKRPVFATRATSDFSMVSCDSERRDGPADDDDTHDEETEALVKKFRTSIFRQEEPASPSSTSTSVSLSSGPWSTAPKEEDEGVNYFELPSIQRATRISDDSSHLSDNSCYDPLEMSSRPTSPLEHAEEIDHNHAWTPSSLSLEYNTRHKEKDPILEARRERPEWFLSPSSSVGLSQHSPLWNISEKKQPFWPEAWTGTFHLGSE